MHFRFSTCLTEVFTIDENTMLLFVTVIHLGHVKLNVIKLINK